MTRIVGSCGSLTECSWIKANQEQIEKHLAWHESVSSLEAEMLLRGKGSFTYLLRRGEEEQAYYISFVKEDGGIKHQRFTLEYDRKGWFYKNGQVTGTLPEIVDETIEGLIPQMMHCGAGECKVIDRH